MPEAINYCDRCARRIMPGDVADGRAIVTRMSCVCAACARVLTPEERDRLAREGPAGGAAGPPSTTAAGAAAHPASRSSRAARGPRGQRATPLAPLAIAVGLAVGVAAALVLVGRGGSGPRGTPAAPGQTGAPAAGARRAMPPDAGVWGTTTSRGPGARPAGESPPAREMPPSRVDVPPAPPVAPAPAPPPPDVPAPATGDWVSLFDGRDLGQWQRVGGTVRVEDGMLHLADNGDAYYGAGWSEYDVELLVRPVGSGAVPLFGILLSHPSRGRGSVVLRVGVYGDGDVHVYDSSNARAWKSGEGKVRIGEWNTFAFEVRRTALKVRMGSGQEATVDLSRAPLPKGGLYLFATAASQVWVKSIRVRVLSQ